MSTNENANVRSVDVPVCSTDNVWRDSDTNRCLSDDLDTIEANISALQTGKADANHSHNVTGFIKSINSALINVTGTANGQSAEFSGTMTPGLTHGATYVLSIKYTSNAGLIDQSVYVVYYDATKKLVSTYNIVRTKTGNDSLILTQTAGTISFALSYYTTNTSATGATFKFI